LIPRRFIKVINPISPTPRRTREPTALSNAGIEMIAATPADTDTATVRT